MSKFGKLGPSTANLKDVASLPTLSVEDVINHADMGAQSRPSKTRSTIPAAKKAKIISVSMPHDDFDRLSRKIPQGKFSAYLLHLLLEWEAAGCQNLLKPR